MNKCIVCGKRAVKGQTIELPAGKIHLCGKIACKDLLTYRTNNNNYPLVWVSYEDVEDTCHPDIVQHYEKNDAVAINMARDAALDIWDQNDDLSNIFNDVKDNIGYWLEREYIKDLKDEDLPLLLNKKDELFTREASKIAFEERLKNIGSTNE